MCRGPNLPLATVRLGGPQSLGDHRAGWMCPSSSQHAFPPFVTQPKQQPRSITTNNGQRVLKRWCNESH
ncbi:unnamed protein product, partial [Iphiclides podalirius]